MFVRLEPQSTAVSLVDQYSVGQRGACLTGIGVYGAMASHVVPLRCATVLLHGTGGVFAEKIIVFLSISMVRFDARTMDAVIRYVAGPGNTTIAALGYFS